MERREFIQKSGVACLGIIVGGGLLSACTKVYYAQYVVEGSLIKVAKSEFSDRSAVVIRDHGLPAPIYVVKDGEVYTAVLMLCTHLGCEITPFGQELHCPCHGSEFSNTGQVLAGPAENPLKKFKVETKNDFIIIT
ncbi:Rieske (2Fe-2S) protein [Reichenbachiella carrageenanivorans]|uniref:Rieske (2Fe-2S) protein n=1 Tax=Reichenbachiella carrageenanivorans TaxID=2979869 RepID=A0ABY6CUP4_9BACT|nr:Rieske (2Fe-2S) protein [Reichenbachiella carrageenanivorans]UXX77642.1 Rieske (2Fe-2S) protein [Reichenbachiella carrageenanivorans]